MFNRLPENITLLGDPHLGRKFRTGVPLHRVGEREDMVWEDFENSLDCRGADTHICMGDLFDKFIVPPEIVIRAAQCYLEAAQAQRGTTFVILEGNHDRSKDSTRSSSFDLFAMLVDDQDNILVVQENPMVWGDLGLVPYHPFKHTEELVVDLPDGLTAVFGHWDIQDWGGHNVIPTKLLAEKGIDLAISGHDHLRREEKRHGVDIYVTGSLQPYTHAEDGEGDFYITTTLAELEELKVTNKNVRVLLREGEVLPDDLDCLSLTAKRVTDEDDKLTVDTSTFESLDLRVMLKGVLDDFRCKDDLLTMFEETSE